MSNDLAVKEELESYKLDTPIADQIEATFVPMVDKLRELDVDYNIILAESETKVTKELSEKARTLRLVMKTLRCAVDNKRKENKKDILLQGRAIDGVANILKLAVEPKEKKLQEIEDHLKLIEQAKLDKIKEERIAELQQYDFDTTGIDLAAMTDDVYTIFRDTAKSKYEQVKAAEEQAAKEQAERDRREDENRIAQQVEIDRLNAEADEREAKEKKQREAYKAEQDRIERVNAAKLKAEQDKQAELQRQIDEKRQAEQDKIDAENARIESANKASDSDKLKALAETIVIDMPDVKSVASRELVIRVINDLENIRIYILEAI